MLLIRSFGALVAAGIAAAQFTAVQQSVDTLSESIAVIGPSIMTRTANGSDSDATIGPLVTQLIQVFNASTTALAKDTPPTSSKFKRQTADDASNIEGRLLSDATQAIDTINRAHVPSFAGRIPAIDTAFSQQILAFGKAIGGNLSLVSNLTKEVSHRWEQLQMPLSVAAVGHPSTV